MEGDKGIELSLGLACGPTSSPSQGRSENSADDKMDTDDRTNKILNDFRNFLNAGAPQSSRRTDPVKPPENFFNNFQQTASGGNDPSNVDMKKHECEDIDSDCSDVQVKEKHSHISITTDEGSIGDNEDMAESEVEVSTSKIAPHCDDGSARTPGGRASTSQAPKETDGKANVSASSAPMQTSNTLNVPYSVIMKESPSASPPNAPIYPLSMPSIPSTTGVHSQLLAANNGSVPVTLNYSSVQIPNKDSPWGMARPRPLHSPYITRLAPTSGSVQVTNPNSFEAARPDVGLREQLRGLPKVVGQAGPCSQSEGNTTTQTNSSSSFPSEYPAIKPGIASEVMFGGSGSFPNLPWVSTTGPGPNGKTISGVTYKYNATQIKIVCACHGVHLSPEEFIRHANEDQSRVDSSTG